MPNQFRIEPMRPNAIGFEESEAGGLRRTLVEVVALGAVTVGVLGAGLRIAHIEAREQSQQPAVEACRSPAGACRRSPERA